MKSLLSLVLCALASLAFAPSARAQLAGSGTPGDRTVYTIGAGDTITDTTTLPGNNLVLDFDTTSVGDIFDSFALGADGGVDDTKIFLTGGHHILIYGNEFSSVNERAGLDTVVKVNGSTIPYGASAAYSRDATNNDLFCRGGTILNVAQGDFLEIESERTDAHIDNIGARTITQQNADVQLVKLDDTNLDFLRLGISNTTQIMAGSAEGPVNISFDVQDEIDASSFDHSTVTDPDTVTLKGAGHYLVFANIGINVIGGAAHRNVLTQQLNLNGSPIDGGATAVYLRHSGATDGVGAFIDDGAVSIGVLVEVTMPNSALTVEISRDNINSSSTVSADAARTGLAIAKLPAYGEYITLSGGAQTVNDPVGPLDLSISTTVSTPSFTYDPDTSVADIILNKDDDFLFLSSFFGQADAAASGNRSTVRTEINLLGGGLGYGAGGSYNRDQQTGADRARFSGNWTGAIINGDFPIFPGDDVTVTTEQAGGGGASAQVTTSSLGVQGINLTTISSLPTVPFIQVNDQVDVTVNDPAFTIGSATLTTVDGDNTAAELTYTVDSVPAGGTFFNVLTPLASGSMFTQADIDANSITFVPGGTEVLSGGFDFTVRDPSLNAASSTFVVRVVEAIVLASDTGTTDEDTLTGDLDTTNNVLTNDTGNSLAVTSFDALSANGAAVNVNSDGTFTYDPTNTIVFQQLGNGSGAGAPSLVDTFTYTVTDLIGKTDTATVTFTVSGIEDAFGAVNDVITSGTAVETGTLVSTDDLTVNDGPLGAGLLLNYDARTTADTGIWENIGPVSPGAVWNLTDVTLNATPGGTRAQITAAYEWDSTLDRAQMTGPGGDSINDIVTGDPDASDATWEFWVRPAGSWDTTVMTIFETGGGGGTGAVIDMGVLIAATELDGGTLVGSATSYDLVADPLDVINPGTQNGAADVAADFHQFAWSIDTNDGGIALYVNGVKVDETFSGSSTDWDGGDGAGLGRFNGSNHGGFVNGAAGTRFDAPFIGQMAMVRLYEGILSPGQIFNNFNAVDSGLDLEGDALEVNGVFDGTTLVGLSMPVTLPSGASIEITGTDGSFTYDPSGAFEDLVAGEIANDTFTYSLTDAGSAGGQTASADVTVTIDGANQGAVDLLTVFEGVSTTFPASAIVGNDQHGIGTSSPFINLDTRAIESPWVNTGSGGATYNFTVTSGTAVPGVSNFGALGTVWEDLRATSNDITGIDTDDSTFEFWFKPVLGSGKQVIYETGGGGTGSSLIYNASTNEVVFKIDNGTAGNTDQQLEVRTGGVSLTEFNQVVVVYDRDNPGTTDSITLYLNNDPASPFNSTPADTDASATSVNEYSGTDDAGIGAINGAIALDETGLSPFEGQIAIFRVYSRALSTSEIEDNYDAVLQPIQSLDIGSPAVRPNGAVVTLNADGSLTYDASAVSIGLDDVDGFDYFISDGAGGTAPAISIVVDIINQGVVIAMDDNVGPVLEESTGTSFDPRVNDTGGAAGTVLLQSDLSDGNLSGFLGAFDTTTIPHGDPADFRDGSGFGWQFLWNAPVGWTSTTTAGWSGTTGPLGVEADYQQLLWDSTVNNWLVDANGVSGPDLPAEPGAYLRISPTGSAHPGAGSTQAFAGNTLDRCLVLAYTVDSDGYYGIAKSTLTANTAGNGVSVETYVNDILENIVDIPQGNTKDFDQELSTFLTAGDTIYIALCPNGSRASDSIPNFDFTLVSLPTAQSKIIDILGEVSTDGSTITYNPNGAFDFLATGQTTTETITYSVEVGGDRSTASFTVTIEGENDAPVAVPNSFATDEDSTTAGNVVTNDTDIDQGDFLGLFVSEVNGGSGNVGVFTGTSLGASVLVNADGSFTYDPGNVFQGLAQFETSTDTFTYTVSDTGLLIDSTTVTITVNGTDDGVIALGNSYSTSIDTTVSGNVILDDTGAGADSSIDLSDTLTILAVDTTGLDGTLDIATPELVGVHGTISTSITGFNADAFVTVDYGVTSFVDPVVIVGPPSYNETEPIVVRVRNVNAFLGTFEVAIAEQPNTGAAVDGDPPSTPDLHGLESYSYLVIDAGATGRAQYQLNNGALVEVGSLSTITTAGAFNTVTFDSSFSSAPSVFNTIQTVNGTTGETNELFGTRSRNVNANSFQVTLEDWQSASLPRTTAETIGWVAVERGIGNVAGDLFEVGATPNSVVETPFTINFIQDYGSAPTFIASQATFDGVDPTQLRQQNLDNNSVQVLAREDTIGDAEVGHATEVVHFLAVNGSGQIAALDAAAGLPGDFSFTPSMGFTGPTSFTYTLTDGQGNTDTTTVTITVDPGSGDPDPDGDFIVTLLEDAFATDPNDKASGHEGLPIVTRAPDGSTVSILFRELDAPGGKTYTVQQSTDGAKTWSTAPGSPGVASDQSLATGALAPVTVMELIVTVTGSFDLYHLRVLVEE